MQAEAASRHRFGPFLLEGDEMRLWRGGRQIRMRPKTFQVLLHLVRNSGHLLSKEALLERVWPDVAVTESTLSHSIQEIRQALEDDAENPRYLQTVPRGGYRFIGSVERAGATGAGMSAVKRLSRWRGLAYALTGAFALSSISLLLYRQWRLEWGDLPPLVRAFTTLPGMEGNLRIVDEIPVRRLEGGKSAFSGDLPSLASLSRDLPHLPYPASVGAEVNPLVVA